MRWEDTKRERETERERERPRESDRGSDRATEDWKNITCMLWLTEETWRLGRLSRKKDLNENNCSVYALSVAIYYDLFAVYIDDWVENTFIFAWKSKLQHIHSASAHGSGQLKSSNRRDFLFFICWILPIRISFK